MPKVHHNWTVLPHGPLTELDDGLVVVEGEIPMPLGNFPRRMTVARLTGGRLAVWSAMALDEPEMARIEAMGRPDVLIVPNLAHRLDAPAWKARYPAMRVLTPPGSRRRVAEVVAVDATDDILEDPDVRFEVVPGTRGMESALVVRRAGGTTLVLNDVVGHVRHPHGMGARVMARLLGWGVSGPRMPRTAALFVKDHAGLARKLREWAAMPDLRRVVVSHGDVIEDDAAGVLRRIAEGLGG